MFCAFFYIRNDHVSGFRKQLKITRIVQVLSWVLRPDCNVNCTVFS